MSTLGFVIITLFEFFASILVYDGDRYQNFKKKVLGPNVAFWEILAIFFNSKKISKMQIKI